MEENIFIGKRVLYWWSDIFSILYSRLWIKADMNTCRFGFFCIVDNILAVL